MTKLKITKYLVIISIMTFLAIFFHIVQNSYNRLIQPAKDVVKSDLLKPVDPNLDTEVLKQIESKKFTDIDNLTVNYQVEITPVPSP